MVQISWIEAIGLLGKHLYTPDYAQRLFQKLTEREAKGKIGIELVIDGHRAVLLKKTHNMVQLDQATIEKLDDNNPELSIDQVVQLIDQLRVHLGMKPIDTNVETWSPLR